MERRSSMEIAPMLDKPTALEAIVEEGLVPVEVGQADVQQRLEIRHDALTGQMNVTYSRCDAVQAMGILAEAISAIFKDTFHARLTPPLNSGPSDAHVWLDERNRLRVSFAIRPPGGSPRPDPVVARGLLSSALFGLSDGDYDPLEAITNGVFVRLDKDPDTGIEDEEEQE